MKFFLFSIVCLVAFSSCKKDDVQTPAGNAVTNTDVAYGTDAKQKMDVYLPSGRSETSTKVLIMIHGGAWAEGDKVDFSAFVDTMKKRLPDYAIININYRLATPGVNLFPTQENDVKAAVDFIYSKRSEYKISDKFVLLGASAGGHLALLQAYKYSNVKFKAVVNFFGPSDMTDMYNNPASVYAPPAGIAALLGGTPTSSPAIYFQSSPINFVSAQSPPTIILQGGLDFLVRPAQQTALLAKLDAAVVTNQYVFYPTESHGWEGANLVNSFDRVQAFLAANVQ